MSGEAITILRAAAVEGGVIYRRPAGLVLSDVDMKIETVAGVMGRLGAAVLEGISERERVGLVLGVPQDSWGADREFDLSRQEAGGRYASPAAFSRTLPSTVAAAVSLRLGIRGPVLAVNAGERSVAVAVRRARAWMGRMGLLWCVAGGVEEEPGVRGVVVLLGRGEGRVGGEWTLGEWVGWVRQR